MNGPTLHLEKLSKKFWTSLFHKVSPLCKSLFSRQLLWLFFSQLFCHKCSSSMWSSFWQECASMPLIKRLGLAKQDFLSSWKVAAFKENFLIGEASSSFLSPNCSMYQFYRVHIYWFFSFSGNTFPSSSCVCICVELGIHVFQYCSQLTVFILAIPNIFLLSDNF